MSRLIFLRVGWQHSFMLPAFAGSVSCCQVRLTELLGAPLLVPLLSIILGASLTVVPSRNVIPASVAVIPIVEPFVRVWRRRTPARHWWWNATDRCGWYSNRWWCHASSSSASAAPLAPGVPPSSPSAATSVSGRGWAIRSWGHRWDVCWDGVCWDGGPSIRGRACLRQQC